MNWILSAIVSILILHTHQVFAQVDTLQLVEIGSIQAPSEITELYVEDLDGDSLKEIILCTDSCVYIYNSQIYQVEWTSPPLNHPTDLLFDDINQDGLIDLSVKDNTNIYLFDPHTPQTIWTSPQLENTYKCYSVGDRNNDGILDLVYIYETFNNISDSATFSIEFYETQDFTMTDSFSVNVLYSYQNYYNYEIYYPIKIFIEMMQDNNGTLDVNTIIIAFKYESRSTSGGAESRSHNGKIQIYADSTFDLLLEDQTGILLKGINFTNDTLPCVFYTVGSFDYIMGGPYPTQAGGFGLNRYTLDSSNTLLEYSGYYTAGFQYILDDFIGGNDNPELGFYFVSDSYMHFGVYSISTEQFLWLDTSPDDFRALLQFTYSNNEIFASPQLVAVEWSRQLRFYDSSDGNLEAIGEGINGIISIYELNGDHNSEVFRLVGSIINIYHYELPTGVNSLDFLPRELKMAAYPNPFNSSTTIEYGLPEDGEVSLVIYDILGREVATPVSGLEKAGRHKVTVDMKNSGSGIYFYILTTETAKISRSMTFLK